MASDSITGKGLSAAGRLGALRREIVAGVTASFVVLPLGLASGVLAFAPLGPQYAGHGAVAGLYGAVYGGFCSALVATSSFVTSSPRTSVALTHASLAAALAGSGLSIHDPAALAAAMALTVLCAGLWQVLFGAFGVARIIKFTPHPVLAGFLNGISLSIIGAQFKPFIVNHDAMLDIHLVDKMPMLLFVILLAAFTLFLSKRSRKIPSLLVASLVGVALLHAVKAVAPDLNLGATLGDVSLELLPHSPLAGLVETAVQRTLMDALPHILLVSLTMAVVATFESLLVFRVAQNLTDVSLDPKRDLIAQGLGNCAAAIAGGVAGSASPSSTTGAFRSGGRTRLVAISAAGFLLTVSVLVPHALAIVPIALISGLLVANGIQLFDRSSLNLLHEALRKDPSPERRHARYGAAVIVVVMATTTTVSVVAGVLAGFVASCAIFIVNMSRPVVRRQCTGLTSKRFRRADDADYLRAQAHRHIVLDLQGVLFFGNADDLSHDVMRLLVDADVVVLDLRGISDIDNSGASILRNLFSRGHARGKRLLFCNVPDAYAGVIARVVAAAPQSSVFPDLESSLEWVEEQVLQGRAMDHSHGGELPLEQHDFSRGLDEYERRVFETYLVRREFPGGTVLCREGTPIQGMWLIVQGSLSVRLRVNDARGSRRIAPLPVGTATGHGILIALGTPSLGDVAADEPVVCYELDRLAFEEILEKHPRLAAKLLMNVGRELRRRLRATFDDFREMTS